MLGKAAGQQIVEEIIRRLRPLPPGSVLLVELFDIEEVTDTALREILAARSRLEDEELEGRYLVFGVNFQNRELLQSMDSIAAFRRTVIPMVDSEGRWSTLGKLTKAERDTLDFVWKYEEITSAQIVCRFGLQGSAASNRLRRLHDLRLLRREERTISEGGGREFIYRPLFNKTS